MSQLSTKHLLGIKDLKADDLRLILSTAQKFKEIINRPIKKVPTLRDITVANLFFENSTRTRVSFELAQKRRNFIGYCKQYFGNEGGYGCDATS